MTLPVLSLLRSLGWSVILYFLYTRRYDFTSTKAIQSPIRDEAPDSYPCIRGSSSANPVAILRKREVPQEHSHRNVILAVNTLLAQNNPENIQDAVFGLLGAAAAKSDAGNIADADCLQQATADQAFTNAKAAGDVDGMTSALIFRTLERNTGSVGLASVPCTSIQAVNPEIAALQQH